MYSLALQAGGQPREQVGGMGTARLKAQPGSSEEPSDMEMDTRQCSRDQDSPSQLTPNQDPGLCCQGQEVPVLGLELEVGWTLIWASEC